MKRLIALLLVLCSPAWAQHIRQPSQMSLDGTFLFATLPAAATYPGYTAYTSDQGPVYSDGSLWHSMSGGGIPPTIATNTVLGNATNATAAPTALPVGTCSTSASALKWTTNTGFGCNTAIDAATLLTGTWAAPGTIGSGTPSTGAFTSLAASSTVSGTGFSAYLASPPAIGGTAPAAGAFTTLSGTTATFNSVSITNSGKVPSTLLQGGIPFVLAGGASSSMGNNGALSALTAIPATLANAYVFALPGAIGNATITSVTISGTAGQFACTCTGFAVGQYVRISGTYGGTGSITGYVNPTLYYVSATDGTSTFTLQTSQHVAIVTTAGTPTGLTYAGGGGWFYAQGSSTTAFTLFNNLYVTGTPTVPGSPTAFSTTGVGSFTQQIGFYVVGPNILIPANTIGVSDELDIDDTVLITNSASSKLTQIQYVAGTSFDGVTYTTSAIGVNTVKINPNGITTTATGGVQNWVATNNTVASTTEGNINLAANHYAQIVLQLGTAATDYMVLKRYSMRLVPQ